MAEEHKLVLQMLQDGKITVPDAERLLAALGAVNANRPDGAGGPAQGAGPRAPEAGRRDGSRRIDAAGIVAAVNRTIEGSRIAETVMEHVRTHADPVRIVEGVMEKVKTRVEEAQNRAARTQEQAERFRTRTEADSASGFAAPAGAEPVSEEAATSAGAATGEAPPAERGGGESGHDVSSETPAPAGGPADGCASAAPAPQPEPAQPGPLDAPDEPQGRRDSGGPCENER